jgi:hypothetical protein
LSNVDWWRMCVRNSFLQVKISSMDWFPLQLRTAFMWPTVSNLGFVLPFWCDYCDRCHELC